MRSDGPVDVCVSGILGQEAEDPPAMPPNRDDRLADIGEKVPGLGGMRLDPTDIEVLNIFLLEPNNSSHVAAVKDAIKEVFPGAIPSGGIQPAQGQ